MKKIIGNGAIIKNIVGYKINWKTGKFDTTTKGWVQSGDYESPSVAALVEYIQGHKEEIHEYYGPNSRHIFEIDVPAKLIEAIPPAYG